MSPEIRFYWRLLLRRAPAMLVLFLICAAVGAILAARLPTTFVSGARMMMQDPSITIVDSTVQSLALEDARRLQQSLMTRAHLLEIAEDHDVFEDADDMSPDEIVSAMRAATTINIEGGNDRRTGPQPVTIGVSFAAPTGQIAANVVNDYVTRITAEYRAFRTAAADSTLAFAERQVERLGADLDIMSGRITAFQRENADALPEDQEFRLQRLALLQERQAAAERERRAFQETRERTIRIWQDTDGGGQIFGVQLSPDQAELQQLRDQLAELLLVFSDSAPQVRQVRSRIELLEERIATQTLPGVSSEDPVSEGPEIPRILAAQLAEIDTRIDQLNTLIMEAEAEVLALEEAIAQSPLNAITLQGLERDYENIQLQYDNAREGLAQAQIGDVLETGDTARRIVLLDPAVVPSAPASPNRPMIAAMGVGAGLGLAAALFLLLELLNRSVRRPAEIVKGLGITPLATIPYIESARRRFVRRSLRVAAVLLVLVGVPALLWAIDTYYQPLDLLAERLLNRFGLT